MKSLLLFIIVFTINLSYGQIASGDYGFGLKIAYRNDTKRITGYFENYTGMDFETGSPKFSCIFYIDGILQKNKTQIITFYPHDRDSITGELVVLNNKELSIKLPYEHGGCWNVLHFADKPQKFRLEKKQNWIAAKYIITDRSYFHLIPDEQSKSKTYIVKDNMVLIDKINGAWSHCIYFGEKKNTTGWIKNSDLSN